MTEPDSGAHGGEGLVERTAGGGAWGRETQARRGAPSMLTSSGTGVRVLHSSRSQLQPDPTHLGQLPLSEAFPPWS